MNSNNQASINVNNVSVNTQVSDKDNKDQSQSDGANGANGANALQAQIKSLSERLNTLSGKVAETACVQAPFDEALGRFLSQKFEQSSLSKRI